jgi:Cu(I)/Ag(I) efflux system membrane protein CusA/SilA
MIDRVIAWSIRHRALAILGGLFLALWGVYAVYHTPVDAIPDLSENQVIVFTDWPGHSPREIEDQITYPLSLNLHGLAGVRVVRASSDFNFSMISVIYEEGVDLRSARQELAERLARAAPSMPPGVTPALAPDAPATGQIFWYTLEGQGYDLGRLRDIQDWYVKHQLSSVPGVAEVASVGGFPREYHIEIDPDRLREHGVSLSAVLQAVSQANASVGGHVIHKTNAEYIVRGVGWLGAKDGVFDQEQLIRDLRNIVLPGAGQGLLKLEEVAHVAPAPGVRRGVLEKDGNEVVGGVVLMRYGENALEVTQRLKDKIQELQVGLPSSVRIVTVYDRTPLIHGAIGTVTGTLIEAIITATIAVVLVLVHFRTSFIIALTLPLATLASFGIMWTLRQLGIADIQTNIMSLAGLAISIGVLVDSSIVMAENAMHALKNHFGDRPVRGDVRAIVLPACRAVGRPIFFSVVIMLLSFLPVFALGGMDGKMFRPLAFTKSFALAAVAALSITLVPALCTIFIRGRLRGEMDSWLVRGVIQVYRPVLNYFLDYPAGLIWFLAVTLLVGLSGLGWSVVFLVTLFLAVALSAAVTKTWWTRATYISTLVLAALAADRWVKPLGNDAMVPLDEGMVMDMPITVPRASITQAADDLKARDMIFCRFPEVSMVVGKAGRAETPTDPAPLDMIETMIDFRPREFWPKRKLRSEDAKPHAEATLAGLKSQGLVEIEDEAAALQESVAAVTPFFDALLREFTYQRNKEFERSLAQSLVAEGVGRTLRLLRDNGSLDREPSSAELARLISAIPLDLADRLALAPTVEDVTVLARQTASNLRAAGAVKDEGDVFAYRPGFPTRWAWAVHGALGGRAPTFYSQVHDAVAARYRSLWLEHLSKLNAELVDRAAATFTRLMLEDLLSRGTVRDAKIAAALKERKRIREQPATSKARRTAHHHGSRSTDEGPSLDPQPQLDALQKELADQFTRRFFLWRKERGDIIGFGGELDRVMQMPGWTNVWTMPIQNRVDMLATGVNTAVGIRVLGRNLDDVVKASHDVAAAVKNVPGAASVIADPLRDKGYLEIHLDRDKAAALGVDVAEVNQVIETALGGKVATTTLEGRERHPVRLRYPRHLRESEETVRELLVPSWSSSFSLQPQQDSLKAELQPKFVPLSQVADVRIVEGPATIKSENGLLRNYVRLNVEDRGSLDFVEEARRVVAHVPLPAGVFLEWTGQFEHEVESRRTLWLILPVVLGVILLILYLTYNDLADALLMILAVPGALAGGVFAQWLFGYKFSVTIWVGYIACFGMATATGIIMLVYLREAVARAGGLESLTLSQLRQAVLEGAVQRLRPKLLTECTTVIGLAPMLWATGPGAEIIRPMAAPVLGGILIADEVIDLLLPVLFFWVRRWRWRRLHAREGIRRSELEDDPVTSRLFGDSRVIA